MRRHLPLILTLAAVAVAVSILVWQVWLTVRPDPPRSPRTTTQRGVGDDEDQTRPAARVVQVRPERDPNPEVLRSLDDPEPVEVKLMAVVKYEAPLHANAPGRMPAKEGERKIGGDTLPPDPVAYAATLRDIDPALLAWVRRWEAAVLTDTPLPSKDDRAPLESTRLAPHELYQIGRGIRYVQGNEKGGLSFYQAAVARAADTLSDVSPESLTPAQQRDRHALRMMARPLWENTDYATAQMLFETLAPLEPVSTFARYRAMYLRAEAPYMRAIRGGEPEFAGPAADAMLAMLEGDTGGYAPSQQEHDELIWAVGGSLYAADRFEQALPHLEQAAFTPRPMPFTQSARLHYLGALVRTGQKPLAREELKRSDLAHSYRRQLDKIFDQTP